MPSDILKGVLRPDAFDLAMFHQLIEERAKHIVDSFKLFTPWGLSTYGMFWNAARIPKYHPASQLEQCTWGWDDRQLGDRSTLHHLDLRGVFGPIDSAFSDMCPLQAPLSPIRTHWCLDDFGSWEQISVTVKDSPWEVEKGERNAHIKMMTVDLPTLASTHDQARHIWEGLAYYVRLVVQRAAARHSDAEDLERRVHSDTHLIQKLWAMQREVAKATE